MEISGLGEARYQHEKCASEREVQLNYHGNLHESVIRPSIMDWVLAERVMEVFGDEHHELI